MLIERLEPRTLLSAGSLDTTFGHRGFLTNLNFLPDTFAVQPAGKLLVAGNFDDPAAWVIVRYGPNGVLDNSFGSKGYFTENFDPAAAVNGIFDTPSSIAVAPDGSIYVGGSAFYLLSGNATDL